MKRVFLALCFLFVSMFSFFGCETTYSMQNVVVKLNEAISSIEIKNYFEKGQFDLEIPDFAINNKEINEKINIINLSMIAFNNFKDMISGTVLQKEANKKDSTKLYNELDEVYNSLKELKSIQVLIETNPNFDLNNTQDKNVYNQWISRLQITTQKTFVANITIIEVLENTLFDKVNLETINNISSVISRTFEAKILKAYLIMLKNSTELFSFELNNTNLFVYGDNKDSSGFNILSEIVSLGNMLKTKTTNNFTSLSLDKIKQILPSLKHCYNTNEFTEKSIQAFDFKSLENNIKSEYTLYNAENLTKYLNNKVSDINKAHYNFLIQEMQNYKNVATEITNLFK